MHFFTYPNTCCVMKHFSTIIFLFAALAANGQQAMRILLVDDSKDNFNNTAVIANALTNNSFDFDYIDAPNMTAGPSAEDLMMYDLVIWHTSSDGVGLDLWARVDENNPALVNYLSMDKGLWIIGNDFMYDRYQSPVDNFSEGDFVYDFLGIQQYAAQAYGDDGNLGVPFVRPTQGQPISELNDINWQFSTLWWADVLTPRQGAVSIYMMGGDGYPLAGQTTGLWFDNGLSKCLTFGFDLSLAASQLLVDQTVGAVVPFFEAALLSNVPALPRTLSKAEVFPNPANEVVNLELEVTETASFTVHLVNALGQHVETLANDTVLDAGTHRFSWTPGLHISSGMCYYKIISNGAVVSRSVIWSR